MPYTILVGNRRQGHTGIRVDRGTEWGNDWSHLARSKALHRVPTVEEAIFQYARWLIFGADAKAQNLRAMLRGGYFIHPSRETITLLCWCAPGPCHASILAYLAEHIANGADADALFESYGARVLEKAHLYGPTCEPCKVHKFD